jgi:large repetitive protein
MENSATPVSSQASTLRSIRTYLTSYGLAAKVCVGVIAEVLLAHLGVVAAVGGLLVSLTVEEAVEQYIRRQNWRARRLWIVSLLIWLLDHAEKALAALGFPRRKRRAGVVAATGPAVSVASVTTAALLVVVAFTTADAVAGGSLVAHRRSTFFSGEPHARSGSFSVIVTPVDGPRLQLPAAVDVEASGPRGAHAVWPSSTSPGAVVVCKPGSGRIFPVGVTHVVCTARAGRRATTGGFDVVVKDTTPPRIEALASVHVATTADATAVAFRVVAVDTVEGTVAVVCRPASGSTFPVGRTAVRCDASDSRRNSARRTMTVTVDHTAIPTPTLRLPAQARSEAEGPNGAHVDFTVGASDPVDGALTTVCKPSSGSLFPLGETTVACAVTNSHHQRATGSFSVIVVDTTPPKLELTAPSPVDATSHAGAAVSYSVSATDLVSGSLEPNCTPLSGSVFPIGPTTVICHVADAAGNPAAAGSFAVVVVDEPPAFGQPATVNEPAAGRTGARVKYQPPTAMDAVDGSIVGKCDRASGSLFPLGSTTVNCVATDSAGHGASTTVTVVVVDRTPPVVTVPSKVLTAPFKAPFDYSGSVSAVDGVDGAVPTSCTPPPGTVFESGAYTTVTCTAVDRAGNVSKGATFRVWGDVPPR